MTETDWLTATDPVTMLLWLGGAKQGEPCQQHPVATDRKLRLFACACCRQIWHLLTDLRSRQAVEVAERHVDGLATPAELATAWNATRATARDAARDAARATTRATAWDAARATAWATAWDTTRATAWDAARATAWATAWDAARAAAWDAARAAAWDAAWAATRDATRAAAWDATRAAARAAAWDAARASQAAFLRCLINNPWRPVTADSIGLGEWYGSSLVAVQEIAQRIYQDRTFGDLPILADALEDAGCDNEDILTHLRGPGPHTRGCWVLDLILGKE